MVLADLIFLEKCIAAALHRSLPDHSQRVSVEYRESPNPLCFFEIDGLCFAQGSFWSNNEYRIEAIKTAEASEFMNESGSVATAAEAILVVERFCDLATAQTRS